MCGVGQWREISMGAKRSLRNKIVPASVELALVQAKKLERRLKLMHAAARRRYLARVFK